MTEFLLAGIVLGASAGMAPGPLMALVISETLSAGFTAGLSVAVAPIITDAPVVILAMVLSAGISAFEPILGGISLLGALFVFHLGLGHFRPSPNTGGLPDTITFGASGSSNGIRPLRKGLMANALSPHPWLFWFTVGGPLMIRALNHGILHGTMFLMGFYGLLVGSKIGIALIVARSRSFLAGRLYGIIMRILGLFLCILAGLLFWESLGYFSV